MDSSNTKIDSAAANDMPAMPRRHGGIRRILQPLLMLATVLGCVTVLAATLRRRPAIVPPETVQSFYRASDFQETVAISNSQIATMAMDAEVQVAERADNLLIARRISLALVGSGLSFEELRAISLVPEEKQIQWWTSYLLEDPRWGDYFAERLSRAYVGTDDGQFLLFRRRKFTMWLSDELMQGVPYNQIVHTLLSGEGLWTDTPQVNFVTATMDESTRADPIRLAGRTARAFLAQRIDCLQCHDDFLGTLNFGTAEDPVDGQQFHFHQLAAFFSGTAISDPVFQGIREDNESYKFTYLGEDEEQAIEPQVPFFAELLPASELNNDQDTAEDEANSSADEKVADSAEAESQKTNSGDKPRKRLADWVTHPENRAFSRATVNRVWALLFSKPLVTPVDSIPLDGSTPPILDLLAEDFAEHGFNLRRLIRQIIETDAFQRASRADFEVTKEHEDCWAVFPLTQLRPEQVASSVVQSAKLTAIDDSSSIVTKLQSFGALQQFMKRFGDRGEDEFNSEAVTIPQRLIMMNGNMVQERTKVDPVANASSRIADIVSDNQEAIRLLFLATLNREPSATEADTYLEHLQEKYGNARRRAVGDIHWALMNSTEFSWNH
ncbi:MAG: DUF1553 domain-containing protein [Pirellulaceae bacterium]